MLLSFIRTSRAVFHHAVAHFHEVLPAIVIEGPHLSIALITILTGALLIAFGAQVLLTQEAR